MLSSKALDLVGATSDSQRGRALVTGTCRASARRQIRVLAHSCIADCTSWTMAHTEHLRLLHLPSLDALWTVSASVPSEPASPGVSGAAARVVTASDWSDTGASTRLGWIACRSPPWTVPTEMSNLATVVASGRALQPSQILLRRYLVTAGGKSRCDGSSWSQATCQFLLRQGSPRLAWPLVASTSTASLSSIASTRAIMCSISCSTSVLPPLSPSPPPPSLDRPPRPVPCLLPVHRRQTSRVTSDLAGTQKKPCGRLCRLRQKSQLLRVADMTVAEKLPGRQPRSIKYQRATDVRLTLFCMWVNNLARPVKPSVDSFLTSVKPYALSVVGPPQLCQATSKEYFFALHRQILHVQRCLSVQHFVQPRTQRAWSHTPGLHDQSSPSTSFPHLSVCRCVVERTVCEMRASLPSLLPSPPSPFPCSDMFQRSDQNVVITNLRCAPAPLLSLQTVLAQAAADVECDTG